MNQARVQVMALLETNELHSGYGSDEIIHGIDFKVELGEVVTILGPNGCGKTTFVKAILGYLRVTRGNVYFRDQDIRKLAPAQRVKLGIGYVPQLLNIFKPLTVRENLEMGAFSLNRNDKISRLESLYDLFPVLKDRASQRANTLSGGERQLLAMARAMMVSPALLFLDEPAAGLSPIRAEEIFGQIRLIAESGTAAVIVEQDVQRALDISDRGYVFVSGNVAFQGKPDDIVADDRIRNAYLGGYTTSLSDG